MPNKPGAKILRQHTSPLRQTAWRAMQIKGKFSLSDLVRNAVPEGSTAKTPRDTLGRYVKALTRAGILSEMKRRMTPTSPHSNGEKRWMLVRDLGRQAPVVRSPTQVYDPNSGAIFGTATVDGVIESGDGDGQ